MSSYVTVDERFPTFKRQDGVTQMLVPVPRCELCFKPIPKGFERTTGLCADCYAGSPVDGEILERVIAVTIYIPKVTGYAHNDEILGLKDRGDFADQYAQVLQHVCSQERVKIAGNGILVPIPRTTPHASLSGPQALADALSLRSQLPVRRALSFTRQVQRQRKLSGIEREKNVENSMVCDQHVEGKPVFLVDDVLTTGNTMHEGARAVKEAGADSVVGLVAGRDAGISSLLYAGVITVVED